MKKSCSDKSFGLLQRRKQTTKKKKKICQSLNNCDDDQ